MGRRGEGWKRKGIKITIGNVRKGEKGEGQKDARIGLRKRYLYIEKNVTIKTYPTVIVDENICVLDKLSLGDGDIALHLERCQGPVRHLLKLVQPRKGQDLSK